MTMVRIFRNRKAYDAAQAQQRTSRVAREVRHEIEHAVKSEQMPVGDAGHYVQHVGTDHDGRRKWLVVDGYGNAHGAIWGLDEAIAACRELIADGRITRRPSTVSAEPVPRPVGGLELKLFATGNDGRQKWAICDPAGSPVLLMWGKAAAEKAARELATAGTFNVGKRDDR